MHEVMYKTMHETCTRPCTRPCIRPCTRLCRATQGDKKVANIYFISGPCGCGKTTLTNALAKQMIKEGNRRQVYVIHGDDFHQGFVTRAYEEDDFWKDGQAANQLEWLEILKFNWECIIDVAGKVLERGLDVLIDYVVEDELPLLQELAKEYDAKLYYLVLTASEEAITKRIQERGDVEMVDRALFLKNKLDHLPENQGHLYDNTGKSVEQEVSEIAGSIKEVV